MATDTNRREFVQVAGMAASGLVAAASTHPAAAAEQAAGPAPKTMGARFRTLMSGPEPQVSCQSVQSQHRGAATTPQEIP
jgi:hypothetical protein